MATLIQRPTRILCFTGKGLERDLPRAGIEPFAWVANQSLTPLDPTDPVLCSRRAHEATHVLELAGHAARVVLEPWSAGFSALDTRKVARST
jgi:arsenite-transporting ATPase